MTSRRAFAGILAAGAAGLAQNRVRFDQSPEVFVERDRTGQPHKGKVLAAIQPHSDDLPLFAAGTIVKLIREGYTGILIRTTNDEMAGRGATIGEVILNNEKDNAAIAEKMGLKKIYNLGYRNHMMEQSLHNELRSRLVFIFRAMKVDTVICYDPWGHYEENPDHYITAGGGSGVLDVRRAMGPDRALRCRIEAARGHREVLLCPGSTADESRGRHQFDYRSESGYERGECDPGSGGGERSSVARASREAEPAAADAGQR